LHLTICLTGIGQINGMESKVSMINKLLTGIDKLFADVYYSC
jgi:hypothetical protein